MLRFPYTLLRYWHLLSLDAPTVAALWCWAFRRATRLPLAPWLPLALAMGTWLFYVADRLLDAQLSPEAALRERHRFHDRHRGWFLAIAALVALALAFGFSVIAEGGALVGYVATRPTPGAPLRPSTGSRRG